MKSLVLMGLAIASVVGSLSASAEAGVACKLIRGKASGNTYVGVYQGESGQEALKQLIPVTGANQNDVYSYCQKFIGNGCTFKSSWVPAKKGPEFQTVEVKGYSHPHVFASSMFPRAKGECESSLVQNVVEELQDYAAELSEAAAAAARENSGLQVNRRRDIGGGI